MYVLLKLALVKTAEGLVDSGVYAAKATAWCQVVETTGGLLAHRNLECRISLYFSDSGRLLAT